MPPRHERLWRAAFQRALLLRARELPQIGGGGRCLVLAPHQDDETLGCGGTIMARLDAGWSVEVAFATDGAGSHASPRTPARKLAEIREAEARAACATLGISPEHLHFLRFPDGALELHATALDAAVAELIATLDPVEILVCSSLDAHADHRALNASAHRVAGRSGRSILEYPVWIWTLRAWQSPRRSPLGRAFEALRRQQTALAQHRVLCSPVHPYLQRKRAALACHATQMGGYEPEPDWGKLDPEFLENFFTGVELFFERRAGR
jgi:LmbE family N-acetylglucosaminyl deacetylase